MELCARRVGSVSALARKAGISQGGIRRYGSGGEPTRPHLLALADAAGVSLSWLATGQGDPDQGAEVRIQRVSEPAEVGLDLLESVTRAAFEELQRRGLRLEPAGQARLVRVLYRHFASKGEQPDHDTVSNIIDLAAYR